MEKGNDGHLTLTRDQCKEKDEDEEIIDPSSYSAGINFCIIYYYENGKHV